MRGDDWRYRAACLHAEPDLFFPIGTTGPAEAQLVHAQRICLTCPVREACSQWAYDQHIEHGVWGGLSEEQRRASLRRTARHRTSVSPR